MGEVFILLLSVLSAFQNFYDGFFIWLNGLTLITFLLIFSPLVFIDLLRSVGKSIFLLTSKALSSRKKTPKNSEACPKVTIIIPAHNEERTIVKSIETALEANYQNKEIIVVDDGSTDKTYALALPYSKNKTIKLLHRKIASGSKAGALNYGLLFASGEVVVTVDADTLLDRDAIQEAVNTLTTGDIIAVSGNVKVLNGEHGSNNLLVKLQAYEYLVSLELGRRFTSAIGTLLVISGAFGAFWTKKMLALGKFDNDTITEDFDITIKMRKIGKSPVFAEKAIARTSVPETWRDWTRQRIRWTRGQVETIWKHRNIFKKQRFDSKFVLAFYDMFLMDVALFFIKIIGAAYFIFLFRMEFLYILSFALFLYFGMELVSILTAIILSHRKSELRFIYLFPIMILIYRPYYAVVRFKAYLDLFLRKKSFW